MMTGPRRHCPFVPSRWLAIQLWGSFGYWNKRKSLRFLAVCQLPERHKSANTHVESGTRGNLAIMSKYAFAALAVLLWGIPQSHAYDIAIQRAFTGLSLKVPTTASVTVCHGFGCRHRTEIGLSSGDHAKLATLLAAGRASPEAERRAVAAAEAWFDHRVGPQAGTTGRE